MSVLSRSGINITKRTGMNLFQNKASVRRLHVNETFVRPTKSDTNVGSLGVQLKTQVPKIGKQITGYVVVAFGTCFLITKFPMYLDKFYNNY